ncbi:MAG: hypothetical protein ACRDTT_05180 [Pseudonocardiaceae bacterium]
MVQLAVPDSIFGSEHVEHEGNHPHYGTDNQRHGDGQEPQQRGSRRSIRPGTVVPPTVLAADMGHGSLFLEGWRDRPSAYQSPADAVPLRRELAGPFGSTDLTPSGDQDDAL